MLAFITAALDNKDPNYWGLWARLQRHVINRVGNPGFYTLWLNFATELDEKTYNYAMHCSESPQPYIHNTAAEFKPHDCEPVVSGWLCQATTPPPFGAGWVKSTVSSLMEIPTHKDGLFNKHQMRPPYPEWGYNANFIQLQPHYYRIRRAEPWNR